MTNLIKQESILFQPETVKELFATCASLAKTPFLKPELRNKPEAVLSIILLAKEIGVQPMTALAKMHFIQGQPTLPVQMMLALAKEYDKTIKYKVEQDNKNESVTVSAIDSDGDVLASSTWDATRASKMGLLGRDQYKKQPLTMYKWRATAEVIRFVCPQAVNGLLGTEEFKDLDGKIIEVKTLDQELEEDFPIPEAEKTIGNLYRIQNGKHRGSQLQDFSREELEEYKEQLEKQLTSKSVRPWHDSLHHVISNYLDQYDHFKALQD